MHVITPITVLFEQHWMLHELHAGHTAGQFSTRVMFWKWEKIAWHSFYIVYPNQTILQQFASIIELFDIIKKCISLLNTALRFSINSLVNLWMTQSLLII